MTHARLSELRRILTIALTVALTTTACSSTRTHRADLPAGVPGIGILPTPASAWPGAGFDARHSSATTVTGPQTDHVRWTRKLEGNITPGPVIGIDNTVIAASNAGVLHSLDPQTGADRWTFDGKGSYGIDLSTSPAVLTTGTILWHGPNDTLYALSSSGTLLWKKSFTGQVLSPAVAGRNRVYVADLGGHLTALEVTATTHHTLWTLDVHGTDYASATVGPDGTIYTAADKDLVAVRDLGTRAAELWRFRAKRIVEVSNGVGPDGTVVLGTNHDREYGIRSDGTKAWSFKIGDNTYSSSTVRPDGTGYFGDNSGRMRTFDAHSGDIKRTTAPLGSGRESIWTSIAVDARGDTYWGSTSGNVYGYRADGSKLFRLTVGASVDSYPAIDGDGTLYLGTTGGTLYAIGT